MNTMTCPCVSLGIWTLDFMLTILNLRDSKCVGTIRTNFPKSVPFLHSVRMALSHTFHVRKLHTKQVISHPKGRPERCWGHGHRPLASFLWVGAWAHCLPFLLEPVVPSGPVLCTCMEEIAHRLVFLQAIHIRENKELCLSQNVSAFESMENLIYFFSQ